MSQDKDIVGDAVRGVAQGVKDSISKYTKPVSDAYESAKRKMNPMKETTYIEPELNHSAAKAHGTTHAEANSHHDRIAKERR